RCADRRTHANAGRDGSIERGRRTESDNDDADAREFLRMTITANAHARAGLVGNPSDGYFGKTISFIIRNFAATVRLWESPHFEIVPTHGDFARFDSVAEFLRDQKLHGYYGGLRLIKAAVK